MPLRNTREWILKARHPCRFDEDRPGTSFVLVRLTTVSVTACSSKLLPFSSNPTQRNLRITLTISLDAVGACLAGISMIVLSRVLAFCCTIVLMASRPPFAVAAFASHNRSDVNFY